MTAPCTCQKDWGRFEPTCSDYQACTLSSEIAKYQDDLIARETEIENLTRLLKLAHAEFCSNVCPSQWKTDTRPPHHPTCQEMADAIKRADCNIS